MLKTSSRDISIAISQFCIAIFFSIILIPLSIIIPKKKNRIVVIGRQNDLFTDNAKHFFLFLCNSATPKPDVVFLVFSRKTLALIAKAGLPACNYPSLKSILYLLTANLVIVDSAEWITQGKFQLTFRSRIIQLWHGAPLKQIELPLYHQRMANYPFLVRALFKVYKFITGRHATYEIVVSTSPLFTKHAFKTAFNTRHIVETGYPRNDAILQCQNDLLLTAPSWLNTDQSVIHQLHKARNKGIQTILYAPTFRKDMRDPFAQKIIDLNRLNQFAEQQDILIIMKLHPVMQISMADASHQCILHYKPSADIYPALSLFDILITDYSSIYFDYLLLDRSIIFFPYDYEQYIVDERGLLFNYHDMAPGPICKTQAEVEAAILQTHTNLFFKEREEVRNLVFTYCDDRASSRLWQTIKTNYLETPSSSPG